MGRNAERVQRHILEHISDTQPGFSWKTEHQIGRNPVDVAGIRKEEVVIIELEWRRADPADNTAKLFRHLSEGSIEMIEKSSVSVFQVFTSYYDLSTGSVSSKRKNAEFVGNVASDVFGRLGYYALDLDISPPKKGEDLPESWEESVEKTVREISEKI